ncbi:MAG: glutaredoxin family protein [Candidatus Heimdallarchaeota archaeon]|nr:glutaredoxin family protein [Candidatus Heimdallarchaeota archaeon]MBY8993812.1 glutaredoxin family protein [Candidatus Heimdallarchaeota archaeon]
MHENLEFVNEEGEKNPCDIQVYALSTCGFCKRGLEFLRKNNLTFRYIYVDLQKPDSRMKIKRDLREKFEERLGFPFVVIDGGDKVLVGYVEEKWKEAFLDA